MAREKMTEMLSEAIGVSLEEANTALEANNWKMLDAAKLLQRQQRARAKNAMAQRNRCRESAWTLRGLIRRFAEVH